MRMKIGANDACPCGSGRKWKRCCGPVIDGAPAASPEALMRSRYSAFATGSVAHLVRSIDPEHPGMLGRPLAEVTAELAAYCAAVRYTRLEILGSTAPDAEGIATVHFRAWSDRGVQEENSRFTRIDGRWVYRAG